MTKKYRLFLNSENCILYIIETFRTNVYVVKGVSNSFFCGDVHDSPHYFQEGEFSIHLNCFFKKYEDAQTLVTDCCYTEQVY